MATGVTPTEVACVVHAYLLAEGHLRSADAFAADAAELLAPVHAVRLPVACSAASAPGQLLCGNLLASSRPGSLSLASLVCRLELRWTCGR